VGESEVPLHAMRMLAKGGVYSIVGYGRRVHIGHFEMIN
jgi:propanol-preferring alcohol dehydrogenase/NAD+-dependent secondary alcohol dehydrogenase Adh1